MLWAVVLLVIGLSAPSLSADFYTDDQVMVLAMDGVAPPVIPGPFQLYTFMSGAPGERDRLVTESQVPWWTVDGIRLAFCRPLSSALLTLDHAIAGRRPLFYHLHSLAWYGAAAVAAALLFRRLLPEREAALAALLFASAPAHWMLAAWPSARHVAISGTFTILALWLHVEARQRSRAWRVGPALLCAIGALAGGETALAVFAYVAAYELFARDDALAQRLRALLPWAALLLSYAVLYRAFHFGVRGAGAYLDPLTTPANYARALPARTLVYAAAALLGVPSEISVLTARAVPVLAGLGVFAALTFAALFRRAQRALVPNTRRTLRWLLIGALLALLPGLASIPGDRVLFLPNLAIAPALSVVLLHAGARGQHALSTLLARAGVALYALVHGLLGPLWFAYNAQQLAATSHTALAAAQHAEIPARPGVQVVGIGLSDPLIGMYLASALYLAPRPEPRPESVRLLSMSAHDQRVLRVNERTLEITVQNGALLEDDLEILFRAPDFPLEVGDRLPPANWTVRVLEAAHGRPSRFSVEFDRSVDDPSLVFLIWQNGALRALHVPPIGVATLVKHELGPMGF